MLDAGLRKFNGGRADLKKAEFAKIINIRYERKYDAQKAQKTFKKLFPSVEDQTVTSKFAQEHPAPVALRRFKGLIDGAFGCQEAIDVAEMDNLAQFLEQKGDGLIDMQNLRLIQRLKYQPEIAKQKAEKVVVQAETDITDILLPLKTELANRGMQPPDLFDLYDSDKNYLLSADELVDILEVYTGYRLTDEEQQVLLLAIMEISGTTGMRTQMKRAEMAKLLELVEVRPADNVAARHPLAALRKLYHDGKFAIPANKDKPDGRLTACEFKHLLKKQGIENQTDINVLCSEFDQLTGFI